MATCTLSRAYSSLWGHNKSWLSPLHLEQCFNIRPLSTLTSLPLKQHSLLYKKNASRWCLAFTVGRRQLFRKRETSHESVDSAAWACRLANENGYLSWCRNSYLLTAAGVTMLYHSQSEKALLCGYGAIFLSGVSLSWGSLMFIYNLSFLRRRVNMSLWFVMLQSAAAIFHCLVFLAVIVVFSEESDKVLIHTVESIEDETEEV